jgi:hypothetical protein
MHKEIFVDDIQVYQVGVVAVRTVTKIIEGDEIIALSNKSHVINPGDDYSAEDARVQAICKATHTKAVVDAYKAVQAAQVVAS